MKREQAEGTFKSDERAQNLTMVSTQVFFLWHSNVVNGPRNMQAPFSAVVKMADELAEEEAKSRWFRGGAKLDGASRVLEGAISGVRHHSSVSV